MTEAQAAELLDLSRRMATALEQLVRARPSKPRDRLLHPRAYAARALSLNRDTLARYIEAGIIRTTRAGRHERISDEELQRHLADGLPELARAKPAAPSVIRRAPRPRAPAPASTPRPSSPGDAIRKLVIR